MTILLLVIVIILNVIIIKKIDNLKLFMDSNFKLLITSYRSIGDENMTTFYAAISKKHIAENLKR